MEKKRSNIIRTVLSLAVAAVLLWLSFRGVGWDDFAAGLRACRWEFVVLSMLAAVVPFIARGVRWRMLIEPFDPSIKASDCVHACNVGNLVNLVLPRVGGIVRTGIIAEHSAEGQDGRKKAPFDKVFGTMLVDRIWDGVFMGLLFVAFLAILWNRYGEFFLSRVLGPASSKLGLVWILLGLVAVLAVFLWLLWRYHDSNAFLGKVWGFFRGIGDGLASCLRMRHGWKFVAWTVVAWVFFWVAVQFIILSFRGVDTSGLHPEMAAGFAAIGNLSLLDGLFIMMVGVVSSLVPVPGGFGAYHYLIMITLQAMYGVPQDIGLLFATLSHESSTLVQLLLGGISYLKEAFSR